MHGRNNLIQKLKKGKVVVGTWCEIPSAEVVNVISKSGLDFVIVDMEHGAMDFTEAFNMVMAADAEGCCPFIRVSSNSEGEILRALEIAPAGIIVPHVESVSDRENIVKYAKFPPIGMRSFNPYTRAGSYHFSSGLTQQINRDTLISIIIESREALKNASEIISDKNIDILYVGAYDLSVSLGVPGETRSGPVLTALKSLVKISRDNNKATGSMFHSVDEYKLLKNLGVQFLCYKVDTGVIFDEYEKIARLNNLK